jgi:hypothetical protein
MPSTGAKMIVRIWRGWTTPSNADQYERVLTELVIPAIAERGIPGVAGPAVLRREVEGEVEFTTVMTFEGDSGVEAFGGADGAAVVPEPARAVLARFDEYSAHSELIGGSLRVERPGSVE